MMRLTKFKINLNINLIKYYYILINKKYFYFKLFYLKFKINLNVKPKDLFFKEFLKIHFQQNPK